MPLVVKAITAKGTLVVAFCSFCVAFILFASLHDMKWMVVAAVFTGIGVGLTITLLNHLTVERSPSEHRGRYWGFYSTAYFGGQFFSFITTTFVCGSVFRHCSGTCYSKFSVCDINIQEQVNDKLRQKMYRHFRLYETYWHTFISFGRHYS